MIRLSCAISEANDFTAFEWPKLTKPKFEPIRIICRSY